MENLTLECTSNHWMFLLIFIPVQKFVPKRTVVIISFPLYKKLPCISLFNTALTSHLKLHHEFYYQTFL